MAHALVQLGCREGAVVHGQGYDEIVLTHQRLPQASVESHRQGWTSIVRQLEEVLASPAGGSEGTAP